MIRNISYILKRIIIGVGIALILGFLRGNLLIGVSAKEISSADLDSFEGDMTSGSTVLFRYRNPSGGHWANWGAGYLTFSFSMSARDNSGVLPALSTVRVNSGSIPFVCDIGSVSNTTRSTSYSVRCPMIMYSQGLTEIVVAFTWPFQQVTTAHYQFSRFVTFEQADSSQVYVDMSSLNNKLQDQMNNDNKNTQDIINSQNKTTNAINGVNDSINDDNVDKANSKANSFFNDFQSDSHGLSGIITAPLRLIESLSSSTCTSLVLPLPFVSKNATLPCMSTVYNQFPTFYSLWQLITTGLIAYWVLIKIFGHIKGMQSPTDDRIEVFNL